MQDDVGGLGCSLNGSSGCLLLDVDQQIEHLKDEGVTFDLLDEDGAKEYLSSKTRYSKLVPYLALFDRRIGGANDGQYVGADFAHLKQLASFDRALRYALLPLTLDVEHFARTKILREVAVREENGCSVVSDYLASLSPHEKNRRLSEMRMLAKGKSGGGLVCSEGGVGVIAIGDFLELTVFGGFIDLYLYCAQRWEDGELRREHYMLRHVKAARNAAAHSAGMVSDFSVFDSRLATDSGVSEALSKLGISRRVRSKKMRCAPIQQIVTLLYLHRIIVPNGSCRNSALKASKGLKDDMRATLDLLHHNDAVRSSLSFLLVVFDNWLQ